MSNGTSGVLHKARRIVIHGVSGVGKSLLAAAFPKPIFMDIEGSTDDYDVQRLPSVTSWAGVFATLSRLKTDRGDRETFVVDTADWAERLAIKHVLSELGTTALGGQNDFGHSYNVLGEQWGKFLDALTELTDAGMHVVVVVHSKIVKREVPEEFGAFDCWELQLEKKCAPTTLAWASVILFPNYKIYVIKDTKTNSTKAQGTERVIYTVKHPCWEAKNRIGLPAEIPMRLDDYPKIVAMICPPAPKTASTETGASEQPVSGESEPKRQLRKLMDQAGIKWPELLGLAVKKGRLAEGTKFEHCPDDVIVRGMLPGWASIVKQIKGTDTND